MSSERISHSRRGLLAFSFPAAISARKVLSLMRSELQASRKVRSVGSSGPGILA